MRSRLRRRDVLKQLTCAGAGLALGGEVVRGRWAPIVVDGRAVEILVASVSPVTVRVTVVPISGEPLPDHNALVAAAAGKRIARRADLDAVGSPTASAPIRAGSLTVRLTAVPPTIHIHDAAGQPIQKLTLDRDSANVSFLCPRDHCLDSAKADRSSTRRGRPIACATA